MKSQSGVYHNGWRVIRGRTFSYTCNTDAMTLNIYSHFGQGNLQQDIHDDWDGSEEAEYDCAPRPYRPRNDPDHIREEKRQWEQMAPGFNYTVDNVLGSFEHPIDLTHSSSPHFCPLAGLGRTFHPVPGLLNYSRKLTDS